MSLKDSVYWMIFSDVWGLMRRFLPVRADDEYWSDAVTLADGLYKKYAGIPQEKFARSLIFDVMSEFEAIYKRKDNKFMEGGGDGNEKGIFGNCCKCVS